MLSNTVCCAVQLSIGDALQQVLHGDTEKNGWDRARSARLGASGVVIGPMMTVWYRYLDAKYVERRLPIVVKKVLIDACTNPVFSSTIITVCGLLEGKTFREAINEYLSKMFHILKVDLSIWPPVQFISFLLLPPPLRVFYINVVYLIYSCIISFIKHNDKEEIEKVL
ncbi:Mpv17 / PMP22 family protein [Dictyocaulus viviparus]|uniref:Mpv17 / PMP22 family protein n=1 Tax=Dictyocaulus viviparus TaxID=29172 RepID=A0A0D8XWP4_DICVI|nr:Mpv17 / PMP22 family protein [Dictyocaulus viviparus]